MLCKAFPCPDDSHVGERGGRANAAGLEQFKILSCGKKGKGGQGTCIKDPWTKTMGGGKDRMWEVSTGTAE